MSEAVSHIPKPAPPRIFGMDVITLLVGQGVISQAQAFHVRRLTSYCDARPEEIVIGEQFATAEAILEFESQLTGFPIIAGPTLNKALPDFQHATPDELIRHAVFPCWISPNTQALIVSDPKDIPDTLAEAYVNRPIYLAPRREIQDNIAKHARKFLLARAQTRVRKHESGRKSELQKKISAIISVTILMLTITLASTYPMQSVTILMNFAVVILIIGSANKTASFFANLRQNKKAPRTDPPAGPMPKISMLVPMYQEPEIVQTLIDRLRHLTYPKAILEVILLLEEKDQMTQDKIAELTLPHWIRVIIVPEGGLKTKPHAMNYALDFCTGDIIGIYDAEDWPEPEQLTRVARRFQALPDDVACLQGILDFYNASQNWLARCFTIEYATWFRMILPGMRRLGFCIPLGGTTLFIRRKALEEIGAWDAHNVTEDADLGIRLARYGYSTEMIDVVTDEEANCHLWPWVKQRSRWLKGYLVTYLVHMRRPWRLLWQIGLWQFLGFQAHFLSAIFQFLLAPVLWSFWLVLFGLPHPLTGVLSEFTFLVLGSLFLSIEVLNITMYIVSVSDPKHKHLMLYAPTMHFYWPIGMLAAIKSVYELVFKPYFWDKTRHGLSIGTDENSEP